MTLEPIAATRPRRVWPPVVGLVAVMWAVELIDVVGPWDLDSYGIRSRDLAGLPGIVASPFLHDGFGHLLANTVPLVVLGLLVSWRAGRRFWPVVATIVVGGGLVVWLIGPSDAVTVGASGLVTGLLTYLIAAGVRSRRLLDVLVGVVVLLVYGTLLLGVVPFLVGAHVSWQAHLGGALAGVLAALLLVDDGTPALTQS